MQVRLAWVAAAVIVAARSSEYVPAKVAVCTHLLAWGLWMGSNIWTTFAVGITMFKNMPRQMFGRVQAKLFPQYFATATAAVVLQMGTLAFGVPLGLPRPQLITLGELLLSESLALAQQMHAASQLWRGSVTALCLSKHQMSLLHLCRL